MATQSQTANGGEASRAIDGNRDESYKGGSGSETVDTGSNYWMLDLSRNYFIEKVNICIIDLRIYYI